MKDSTMISLKIFALLIALNAAACMVMQDTSSRQESVSYQLFYDELSPYGMWVDYPNYGYVWMPNGDPEFSPYVTSGHWIFTEDGWTWVSDYPWGWATFHYGRWDYDNFYGWFWVPDYEWGPAWVSWRSSPGYYGWAPLRPGISISIAFGANYHERNERWIFVRDEDISRRDVGRHYVDRGDNVRIINNSTVIVNTRKDRTRNVTYIAGPDRDDVQRATRAPVTSVAIRENNQPGHRMNNGELEIYRPQVQKGSRDGRNSAPSKVMKLNDMRPASERNAIHQQRDANPQNIDRKDPQPESGNTNPSNSGEKDRQRQNVAPTNVDQQPQPREVNPTNAKEAEKKPQSVAPTIKDQQPQPRTVNPPNNSVRERQPQNVPPPNRRQPPQRRNIPPSESKGKDKEPPSVSTPEKGQSPNPRIVNPSDRKRKENQPQKADPSNKKSGARLSQPKTNQDENDSEIIKKKAATMFTRAILTIYNNKLLNQPKR